jgi:ATP/maltotriose-dependent transcriptional regulator MalT
VQKETAHRRGEAFATSGLGDLYLAQGEIGEARKYAEEALQLRQDMGETLNVALSNMQLGIISLEEGQPEKTKQLILSSIPEFEKQSSWDLDAISNATLARAALEQHDLVTAQDRAAKATSLAHKAGNRPPAFEASLASARVSAASGKTAQALNQLEGTLAEAKKFGYFPYELETRLAIGQIELKSGKTAAGRNHLSAVERDARGREFNLVADKAAKSRK